MPDAAPMLDPRIRTLRLDPSFGFGDRTGLGTPGHVSAMRTAGTGIQPIFPQQSIREMTRTNRTAKQVMADALRGMDEAGWTEASGADADHLKSEADVDVTTVAGFSFYTIDPSDAVDNHADDYDASELEQKYRDVREVANWVEHYAGKSVALSSGTRIEFDNEACMRAAVKYGRAVSRTLRLADYLRQHFDGNEREYELELSVDETPQPTTLVEHWIIAEQCLLHNLPLVSLAPRFPGDFEKGIDFKGDLTTLERSLHDHAAIASTLGPYKLSLHSGSDKLSIYRQLAAATQGRFHVKTAGTSYLEAVRVAARHADDLFRRIIDYSRARFDVDKATYHLSATLDDVPPPAAVSSLTELERLYLESWSDVPEGHGFTCPGRQILHCTFGSVLTNDKLGAELHQVLREHPETYAVVLEDHFVRHLRALQSGIDAAG